jgi:nitrite reductase/ring-hydroxylating ferredoxin subunit
VRQAGDDVTERRVNRFVSDLLRGRRPRRFRAQESEATEMRAAITLRAARQGAATPREEFVTDLRRRLADHVASQEGPGTPAPGTPAPNSPAPDTPAADSPPGGTGAASPIPPRIPGGLTRRRLVATTGLAAGAAAVAGAGVDHLLTGRDGAGSGTGADESDAARTLEPNVGQWRTVAASADLPEGRATGFDLGVVTGFVSREGGSLEAVSAICTHLGCRLALNAPQRRLDCPCHNTSFALDGELVRHQLPTPPAPLPKFQVRESDGSVQVFAPRET